MDTTGYKDDPSDPAKRIADQIIEGGSPNPDRVKQFKVETEGESITIAAVDPEPLTPDEAMAKAGLDPRLWIVSGQRMWQTPMKFPFGVLQVFNVYYRFDRKAPRYVQEGTIDLMENWDPLPLPDPVYDDHGELCAVASFNDAHFGKLCYEGETEQENYDLHAASRKFAYGAARSAAYMRAKGVEKIFVPIGNDFFHIDNWRGETTSGTQMDFDSRYTKVYKTGVIAIDAAIRLFRDVAPVDAFYVPGNHDRHTSWHLTQLLRERFKDDPFVIIDDTPTRYKQRSYGETGFMYLHSDGPKNSKDIALLASTVMRDWSNVKFREVHCAHKHKREKWQNFVIHEDEINGTVIRWLSCLSGSDWYHYENGWIGNHPAVDTLLYEKTHGYTGHDTARVGGI